MCRCVRPSRRKCILRRKRDGGGAGRIFFFFQAEDGIRDVAVTGVQTCALPISMARRDPVMFVVSMMDKEHADFDRIYQQIKTRLTSKVIPVEVPVGQGADFQDRKSVV